MADEVAATEDVKVEEVVSTDITPDDFLADEQETAKAEPSTATKEPETVKAEVEAPIVDAEAEAEVEKETDGDKPVETEATLEPPKVGKADERKTQLNTEIRDLVAQRNALKEQVEKANGEVYQPESAAELEEQGLTTLEAKVEAMRQSLEMEKYNAQVTDAQLTMSSEADQILRDYPIFDPSSTDFDKDLAEGAAEVLEANLIKDPNTGQIIGTNISVKKLYQTLARASGNSTVKGQIKGQQDAETMLANADSGASRPVSKKVLDPVIALWESDD